MTIGPADTLGANAVTAERFLAQVDDQRLAEAYRYWDRLRGTRWAPAYAEVDPVDIPRLLPHLLVIEVEPSATGQRYRYRLCGTAVEEHFGIAMGGCYIDTLIQGAYRDYIERLYDRLVQQRSPVYSVSTYDDRMMQTKRLMLPLSSNGERVDMVLAAQVFFRSARLSNTVLAVQAAFKPELEHVSGK